MPNRSGMTLLEVMVTISIAGIVLLLARETVASAVDTAAHVRRAQQSNVIEANSSHILGELLANAHVNGDRSTQFWVPLIVDAPEIHFSSWIRRPQGGFESARVMVARSNGILIATIARPSHAADTVVLSRNVSRWGVSLLSANETSSWQGTWDSATLLPCAVRLTMRAADDEPRIATYMVPCR